MKHFDIHLRLEIGVVDLGRRHRGGRVACRLWLDLLLGGRRLLIIAAQDGRHLPDPLRVDGAAAAQIRNKPPEGEGVY